MEMGKDVQMEMGVEVGMRMELMEMKWGWG